MESVAPEYDPSAGVAIYWRDLVMKAVVMKFILIISYFDRQSGETTRSLIQSSQGELLK